MLKVRDKTVYLYREYIKSLFLLDPIKVSRQVDGTAGDTSDEDGSDISDDQ